MIFLQELTAMTSVGGLGSGVQTSFRLTDTQKTVLVNIYGAPTPEMAYEATTGSDNVAQATQQLRNLGLINVDSETNRAGVTDAGQVNLINNNLIDDMGELTDEGQELINQQSQVKSEFVDATESVAFPILRNLI